jgi:two-component system sensor histidine kinase KdpD
MDERRPDPDEVLARVRAQEARARRGKLKIFFGACAGVGKTYGMLQEARERRRQGADVVIGYLEPHGRTETEVLAEGLERIAPRLAEHRGAQLREFDLDAALARHPQVILVDELAHTNAPGSRHGKRWQDIDELRDAGIDVHTTVNVQHLESLNDVVVQITGVRTGETLPDRIFDEADEVELIDQPPDDLLQRLREGKIYIPEQIRHAVENFFRKGNLIALRELALRKTADRVDAAMREYREDQAIKSTWAARDRILVCLGPGEQGEHLVRAARRLATALRAEWLAVYVETPRLLRLPERERDRRIRVLQLAESLGGQTVTLGGRSAAEEILNYARMRNVNRILVGRPTRAIWLRLLQPSTADQLIAASGDIDVEVVSPNQGGANRRAEASALDLSFGDRYPAGRSGKPPWPMLAWGAASTALCTALAWLMSPYFAQANLIMVYLLGVVVVSLRFGRRAAALAAVLNVLAFDFFFVPPQESFQVADIQYLLTFGIMLTVALIVGSLTASVRLQARVAGYRERRTAMLYGMSRELAITGSQVEIARTAVRHTAEVFDSRVVVLLPGSDGRVRYPQGPPTDGSLRAADLSIAQWVSDHAQRAGLGTDTLPGSAVLYLPLTGATATLGVLGVLPTNPRRVLLPEQLHLLETFAGQIALALERTQLESRAQQAQVQAETEELRNSLLSAISHDLRTPLAVIAGAASSLVERGPQLTADARDELGRAIYDEARQMSHLVSNLLDMTRLESGAVPLNLQWHSMEEIIGSALRRMERHLGSRRIHVELDPALPLVRADAVLLEQLLINLLENAGKYTRTDSQVWISAGIEGRELLLRVADDGPGFPPGQADRIFEKFHRGSREGSVAGVGLGLAICRSIVHAHHGRISAKSRSGGGAEFTVALPAAETPPSVQ